MFSPLNIFAPRLQIMKKYIFLFVCFAFNVSILSANEIEGRGQIAGQVTTSDGQPAAFVTVSLEGTRFSTLTGENGRFVLRSIPEGNYQLEVTLISHGRIVRPVTVDNKKTTSIALELSITDKELQEVVITAVKNNYSIRNPSSSLKLAQPLLEIPQNIQVVTSTALTEQQVISMSDNLIRNVSGATRLEHWGDLYTNITMRGSQIQAFRNGFNVVSSYWGPLTEDMSFVDHIEFVKGPAGFMLANGDPSGLYNVVTKKPTGKTKGELSLTTGSFNLFRGSLDLDGKLSKDGKLLYRLNLAGQNKGSHRPYEFNNRYSFAPVISYQLDDQTKITAEYTWQRAEMSDIGSYYVFSPSGYATLPRDFTTMPPGLPTTKIDDQSISVNLQHDLSPNWKLTAQTAYYDYKQQGTSMWPASVNPDGTMIRSVDIWDAKSKMTLAQAFLNGEVTTGGVSHRILTGIDVGSKDYWADWIQSHDLDSAGAEFDPKAPYYGTPVNGYPVYDRSLNLEARAVNGGGLIDQRYSGVYVQDELGFLNNTIRLTLAGRYTTVTQSAWGEDAQSANRFTPRLGLSVSVNPQTSFYALYDQAFIPQSGRLADGGHVQPITGNNMELGIKKDWADGRWNTSLSIYRILKNNELTADPNSAPNSGLSVELGQKRAQGIEFDIKGTLAKGLNLTANYAYTNAEVTKVTDGVTDYKVGDVLPGYAKNTMNAWLSYRIQDGALKGTGISGGFTWLTDRATSNWSKTNGELNLPDYFKLDGGLFWENQKLRLTLNVFNVLNEYLYIGGYYDYLTAYYWQSEPPRSLRFSINYKF